jgi:hypothetical protein
MVMKKKPRSKIIYKATGEALIYIKRHNSKLLKQRRENGLMEAARKKLFKRGDVLLIDSTIYRLLKKSDSFWVCDDPSAECKGFFNWGTCVKYMLPIEDLPKGE